MANEAVKTTINGQVGWWGYMGRVIWVEVFYVGRCVLREWVVGGGGLDGYFGKQGLPVGIQGYRQSVPEDGLTISPGRLLQNGAAPMLNTYWRRQYKISVGET